MKVFRQTLPSLHSGSMTVSPFPWAKCRLLNVATASSLIGVSASFAVGWASGKARPEEAEPTPTATGAPPLTQR
jgi:hypothetical protein